MAWCTPNRTGNFMAESSFDKFTRFIGQLRTGVVQPSYLILGPEEFLTNLFIKTVRTVFREKFGKTAEISMLYGDDLKREELQDYLAGGGLFSTASLVVIQNIAGLDVGSRKLLELVLARENEGLFIVLTHNEDYRLPQWITKLGSHGQTIPAVSLWENEIPRLVHRFAEIRKKKIQPQGVELLMQLTGNNLALIEQEMDKLDLYLPEDEHLITVEAIQKSAAAVSHATILNLSESVNERNGAAAIGAIAEMTARDDSVPYLVINLYNHINKILGFRDHKTFPDSATARAITGSGAPNYQHKLFSASRRYDAGTLEAAVIELAEIDYQFRQKSIPTMAYFTGWVANHFN